MGKRKTTEEFKINVYDLVKNEYSVLGEYVNNKTKILMKHNKCDNEYLVRPDMFLKSDRCPYCSGRMKKTTELFKKEVYELVGDEYSILGEYINSKTKILIKHNKCGNEYMVTPDNFLNARQRCPKCYGNIKKNTDQFKKEVYKLVKDEYTVLGEYINSSTKILIRHNKCGNEYIITPNNFLSGNRCPYCSGKMMKTIEQYKKEVYELVGDEYTVLGEYKNNSIGILMKHNKCGYEYMSAPNTFLSGYRCPYCYGNIKKTTNDFKKEVYDLVKDEYTVLGEYVNTNTKILMKHNKCGNEYMVTPNMFLNKMTRCPKCCKNVSKGEKLIQDILDKLNLYYKSQYIFKDCKYKTYLPFDFALFDDYTNEIFLIEYDGEQHFKPINRYNDISLSEEEFLLTVKRDKIKDKYCEDHKNVHLLRLNYKMDKIEIYEKLIEFIKDNINDNTDGLIKNFKITEINDYRK